MTKLPPTIAPPAALAAISDEIRRTGYAFRSGAAMRAMLSPAALAGWSAYAESWNDLGQDLYMADGGRYRRRRFATFRLAGDRLTRKPHQPHYQSTDYNALNGGLERWFEPVNDPVAEGPFNKALIHLCQAVFEAAPEPPLSGLGLTAPAWHAEMHQFRIEAGDDTAGRPTPEGAHRDGVDWVCVMMVGRRNVSSGVTEIFEDGKLLGRFTLTDPLDAVFIEDARIRHGVTPIAPLKAGEKAIRDVLVLTLRVE